MSLVSCKNAAGCTKECILKEPHGNRSGCRDFPNGCCCVPVPVSPPMVKCDKANYCSLKGCDHEFPHVENSGCVANKCDGVGARCVPYVVGACGGVEVHHHFILTPSIDHPEANITIQAKDRTEALEIALKQLGWELL